VLAKPFSLKALIAAVEEGLLQSPRMN